MTPEEVPANLVQTAADVLKQNGLWGAWEPEQTEDEVRNILAAVLPLHAQQLCEATRAAAPPRPRLTVVVTQHPKVFDRWCWENKRNPRDRTIIRISDGHRDQYKLQGICEDFDVVVLSEIPHHNQAMALISHRLATAPRKDQSQ